MTQVRGCPGANRVLVLWRHAKSAWDRPDLADAERCLAPRGRRAAPEMAAWIADQWAPDAVICSPAQRTVETWGYLARRLAGPVDVTFDPRIYEAAWPDLLTVFRRAPADARTVLIIGHNPGLEELAAALGAPVRQKFVTAAAAVIGMAGDWPDITPGSGWLADFRRPAAR